MDTSEPYKKALKYINLFILQVIGFSLLYKYETRYRTAKGVKGQILKFPYLVDTKNNLEIIGVGLTIAINILVNTILFIDIANSPKHNDFVVYVLLISIIALFISEIFTLITLSHLHHNYKVKGSPIQFTRENRIKFNELKALLVSEIVIIGFICLLYFTLPKTSDTTYQPFFNFNNEWNTLSFWFSCFKVLLSMASIGIVSYLIYATYKFSKLKKSQITDIETKPDYDLDKIIGTTPGFFENINLNFLANYKYETLL
jgi:hypothetical protein